MRHKLPVRRHRRSVRSSRPQSLGSMQRDGRARLGVELLEERMALTTLPAGFNETLITDTGPNLSGPTAMEISPTGQIWVLEQGGNVRVVRQGAAYHTALSISVNSVGERGLLGIAFDPSYDGDGPNTDYVYLYYTAPDNAQPGVARHNRLSRFTATGAGTLTPTLGSELILRELPPEAEDGNSNHNGGAIHFGLDGKLYVAVGDHNYDQIGQAGHVSQILTTPFGKMLRLDTDGTNAAGNPFYDNETSWQGAIWALGLRNPFTFAVQPGTGRIFINDVGEGVWEEINDGVAGANYGWAGSNAPVWEGFESPPPTWANYHDPIMAYSHGSTSPGSTAITGGVFYPAGSQFGPAYAGKYFYTDLGGRYIRVFDPANPGTVAMPDKSTAFATNLTTGLPVDTKVDAHGNLYYLAIGGPGEVYRISANHVAARQLFYNESSYDGQNAAIGTADDGAIALDKTAYLPGDGLAQFDNVSSYSRGINGIMIDLSGTGNHGSINVNDFVFKVGNNNSPNSWMAAPAPSAVSVRAGAGQSGSDRVVITWPSGAITNTWLEVQMLATANTGLPAADVFFFGSKVGDTGGPTMTEFTTTAAGDATSIVAGGLGPASGITDVRDIDRTGVITASGDRNAAVTNLGSITRINIGTGGPFAPLGAGAEGGPTALTGAIAAGLVSSWAADVAASDVSTRATDVTLGMLAEQGPAGDSAPAALGEPESASAPQAVAATDWSIEALDLDEELFEGLATAGDFE